MAEPNFIAKKPLPSLAQYLSETRGEGFEEWLQETLAIESMLETDTGKASSRMIRTLSVAIVEVFRAELDTHDRDYAETVMLLSRALGFCGMAAIVSGLKEDAPLKKVKRWVVDDFRVGADFVTKHAMQQTD